MRVGCILWLILTKPPLAPAQVLWPQKSGLEDSSRLSGRVRFTHIDFNITEE